MSYREDCVTLIRVTERKFSGTEGKALFQGLIAAMPGTGWELWTEENASPACME